jgi:O-antigen/teichoic acid export membrane protein
MMRGGIARNTVLNLLGLGLPLLVAIAAMPVLARELDAARFGLLAFAWLVHGFANELGFGRATTKFAAELAGGEDDARLARVAWSTIALQLAFGLLAGAVLLLAAPALVQDVLRMPAELVGEARRVFTILAFTIPVVVTAAALRGLLEALGRFDLVNAVRGPTTAATFALPVAGVAAGLSVSGMVALLLLARVGSLLAYGGLAVWRVPALARPAIARVELRRVASFGGWTSVSGVLSPLLIYLDRFLLGALVSMAAVAYYAAPYEVVARLLIVPASVVGALFPELSRLHDRGDAQRVGELAARGIRTTLLAVGPAAVLLVATAPDLLRVWLGAEFAAASAAALQILAVGIVINAVAHVPVTTLQSMGRPDLPARFHLLEVPLHAVVAVLLIRNWGVTGAAAAWTVRVTLDAALLLGAQLRIARGAGAALRAEGVPAIGAVLGTFALAAAAVPWIGEPWARWIAAVAIAGGATLVAWRFGVRGSDRERIARRLAPVRAG